MIFKNRNQTSGITTSLSVLSDVDVTTAPVNDNVLTFESGKWIPKMPTTISGSTLGSYTLELNRWGIINSISDANSVTISTNNSNGINSALAWASSLGYAEVGFPLGSYLINETVPITPQSFQTINLNGSTLRIRNNALTKYTIIAFTNEQKYSRITNGKLQGDRYAHDYYLWNYTLDTALTWTTWQANSTHTVGQKILPSDVSGDNYIHYWICTVAGTSGSTEPIWNQNSSALTTDGEVTWQAFARHTHEWGYGICVGLFSPPSYQGNNCRFISTDNLEIFELTGDGVSYQNTYGLTYFSDSAQIPVFESGGIYMGEITATHKVWRAYSTYVTNDYVNAGGNIYKYISGSGYSTSKPIGTTGSNVLYGDGYTWLYKGTLGASIADSTRIRMVSTQKILMSNTLISRLGYFGIYGDSYGGIGTGITANQFDLAFFNADNSYNTGVFNVQYFDEVDVPTGSSYAKLILHQGTVPANNSTSTGITLKVSEFPKYVYTEKCNIHDNRRLAISVTGAKHIYIRGNELHHISGTGPAGSIDIEDGYRLNQHIYIEDNTMHHTSSGLTVVGGRYIHIVRNKISDAMTIWNMTDSVTIDNNDFVNMRPNLYGEVLFSNNRLLGCLVSVTNNTASDKNATIQGCNFYNSTMSIVKSTAYIVEINNCKFYTDAEFHDNMGYQGYGNVINFCALPQTMNNCTFSGSGTKGTAFTGVASNASEPWIMNGITFANTKHIDNITNTLPPAIYTGCRFINSGTLQIMNNATANAKYQFENCYFQWDGFNQYGTASDAKVLLLKFNNCLFSGGSSPALYLWTLSGKLILTNNTFDFPSASSAGNIINVTTTFNPESVLISGNKFKSNQAMVVADFTNAAFASTNIIFKDNVLDTVLVKLLGTHNRKNNYINGVLDPYFTVSVLPTTGYYALGQQLLNGTPASGGYIGWICTIAGTANTNAWTATTAYTVGQTVNANGKVYSCTVAGTSGSTAPSHTTGTATDGGVTWQYVDVLAIFKQFGFIQ